MKISKTILVATPGLAVDLLAAAVPELSKGRLKDAMNKGAVIWRRGKQTKRLRRAQSPVAAGEQLELNYDDDLLSRQCEAAVLLADERTFSVWYKPPGMLSQGNEWGDHLSLLRFAEQQLGNRAVFLIHRLDREASGLLLLAHSPKLAAALSQLIAGRQMAKHYQVLVRGKLADELLHKGVIDLPLDGKKCETHFKLAGVQPSAQHTLLDIQLISGRKHQIRRHFAAIGHAVMGDPRYGEQNQDPAGLGLQAVELSFQFAGQPKLYHYTLPKALRRYAGTN
ncbi:RluA family pseudouridine synthase [Rheinheimera sp.]|uniref:RluA family pseudouridine synthase n=1 Tax=Rheinheimera sp. TaxID=1869214 RepID=UPI0027B8B6AF|nr:RNA pseudouridine synthase [Rheinheimera sp.]